MFCDKKCIVTQSAILDLADKIVSTGDWWIAGTYVNEEILTEEEGFTLRHTLYAGTTLKIQVVAEGDLRVESFKAYVLECNLPGKQFFERKSMLDKAHPLKDVLQTTAQVLRSLAYKILEEMGKE